MEFTGSISDTSSGLYYMNARYYNPKTGRFLTQDAAGGDAWTNNLYAYCGNNPVNFIDPTGYREIIADDGHGGLITAPPSKSVVPKLDDNDKDKPKYPDWLKDLVDNALEHADELDDYFGTKIFGRLAKANNIVNNAIEARMEILEGDKSAVNHWKNIWNIGSGDSEEILPVIVKKEETKEGYIQYCKDIYKTDNIQSLIHFRNEENANEVYGFLSVSGDKYYAIHYWFGVNAGLKYFPKAAAEFSPIPWTTDIVDSLLDASSPYKVLE